MISFVLSAMSLFNTMGCTTPTKESLAVDSKLCSLPPETIAEVMEQLDWFSLMNVRKTCRYLHDVSKSLAVWQGQLRRYVCGRKVMAPLNTFTASELEDWVSRRLSADLGWKSENRRPTRIRTIKRDVKQVCIVPGGRWLLTGVGDENVTVYDLDALDVQGRLLLNIPDRVIISMCVSIDKDSPNFAFHIATSSYRHLRDWEYIHVWAVSISGRGREAYLQARPLRSFRASSSPIPVINIKFTLYNDLVARTIHGRNGFSHIVIFNWSNTSSTSHCKQVIHLEEAIHHIQLLPGNRLLVFTDGYIRVYNVQPVVRDEAPSINDPVVLPRWQLSCPLHHRTANGGISEALIDTCHTQFTFVAEEPNTIYGLTIPHDKSKVPVFRKIANLPGNWHYPAIAIGFEKMFIAFESNWQANRDKLSGSIVRLGIPWIEDSLSSENTGIPAQGVRSDEYPTEWYVEWPPLLDEASGRIVQRFGRRGLLVLDTALWFA